MELEDDDRSPALNCEAVLRIRHVVGAAVGAELALDGKLLEGCSLLFLW